MVDMAVPSYDDAVTGQEVGALVVGAQVLVRERITSSQDFKFRKASLLSRSQVGMWDVVYMDEQEGTESRVEEFRIRTGFWMQYQEQSSMLLAFLQQVNTPLMRQPAFIRNACHRYQLFLKLTEKYPEELLYPPLDVALIWYIAALKPSLYWKQYIIGPTATTSPKPQGIIKTLAVGSEERKQQWEKSAVLWEEAFPEFPYLFSARLDAPLETNSILEHVPEGEAAMLYFNELFECDICQVVVLQLDIARELLNEVESGRMGSMEERIGQYEFMLTQLRQGTIPAHDVMACINPGPHLLWITHIVTGPQSHKTDDELRSMNCPENVLYVHDQPAWMPDVGTDSFADVGGEPRMTIHSPLPQESDSDTDERYDVFNTALSLLGESHRPSHFAIYSCISYLLLWLMVLINIPVALETKGAWHPVVPVVVLMLLSVDFLQCFFKLASHCTYSSSDDNRREYVQQMFSNFYSYRLRLFVWFLLWGLFMSKGNNPLIYMVMMLSTCWLYFHGPFSHLIPNKPPLFGAH